MGAPLVTFSRPKFPGNPKKLNPRFQALSTASRARGGSARARVCVCARVRVLVWERAAEAEVMADERASSVRPLRVLEFYSGIGGMVRPSVSPSVFMFSLCQFGCVQNSFDCIGMIVRAKVS